MAGMTWLLLGAGGGSAALLAAWLWWLGRIDARIGAAVPPAPRPPAPPQRTAQVTAAATRRDSSPVRRTTAPTPPPSHSASRRTPAPAALPVLTLPQLAAAIAPLPGIAILGPSRQGKTTLAEALIRIVDGDIAIIDPKWRRLDPPKWGGFAAAHIGAGDGYRPIEAQLAALWRDYEARIRRGHAETNARFNPLWIVWDEINDTVAALKDAGGYLRRWAQMGAEHGIRLIIMPQSDRVQSLGLTGHGDARRNLAWCFIGDDARSKARELQTARKLSADQTSALLRDPWPALVEVRGRWAVVDRRAAPQLLALPLAPWRDWNPAPAEPAAGSGRTALAERAETSAPAETASIHPESVSAMTETSVSALPEPAEALRPAPVSGFSATQILPLARLVDAGLLTETNALKHGCGVKPGGSKEYQAAREALKQALARLREQQP